MNGIKKVLFFDLETVGMTSTYDDLKVANPRLHKLWALWQDKYKETNGEQTLSEVWLNKSGLHAEYGKVVCASFGYYDKDMNIKITSFYGDDEKDILTKCAKILNNSDSAGFSLSGYNIKKFDIPFLWKRMLINNITPPKIINVWDKKPWELKFLDIAEMWNGGTWNSFTSMDTVGALFNVDSSKADLKGDLVHEAYWNKKEIERIKDYCEQDVIATMSIANNFLNIINCKLEEKSTY